MFSIIFEFYVLVSHILKLVYTFLLNEYTNTIKERKYILYSQKCN